MKRREFLKGSVAAVGMAGLAPAVLRAQTAPTKELVVAGTVSESGGLAPLSSTFDTMAANWAKLVNEEEGGIDLGGGKKVPIRFNFLADDSSVKTVQSQYRALIGDSPNVLIGPYGASQTFAIGPLAEQAKIPLVATEANSPKLYNQGWDYISCGLDYATKWATAYFDMQKAIGKAKTFAFVGVQAPWAADVYEGGIKIAKEAGFDVPYTQLHSMSSMDFSSEITRLRVMRPDVVYLSMFLPFNIAFVKQALQSGLPTHEYHAIGTGGGFLAGLGAKAADGVTTDYYWAPGMRYGNTDRWRKVLKMSGMEWQMWPWASVHYMAFEMIKGAAELAQSTDPRAINEALHHLDGLPTILGPVSIHDNGHGNRNTLPAQVQDGEFNIIWPEDLATGSYQYPSA